MSHISFDVDNLDPNAVAALIRYYQRLTHRQPSTPTSRCKPSTFIAVADDAPTNPDTIAALVYNDVAAAGDQLGKQWGELLRRAATEPLVTNPAGRCSMARDVARAIITPTDGRYALTGFAKAVRRAAETFGWDGDAIYASEYTSDYAGVDSISFDPTFLALLRPHFTN